MINELTKKVLEKAETRKVLEGNKEFMEVSKPKQYDSGVVVISPNDTMSSVKIEQTAGGTRVTVKSYSTCLEDAVFEAMAYYDTLRKKYKENED